MFNAYKAVVMRTTMSAIINLVILAGLHSQIWAMPVDNLGCNTVENSNFEALRGLVHKVRIIDRDANGKPKDDRKPIDEFNWPASKEETFYRNTGQIHCPDMPMTLSASIVGSDVTLLTAEHALFNEDGTPRIPIEKFKECYFENRVGQRVAMIFEPGSHKFGNQGTIQGLQHVNRRDQNNMARDFAIIRLAHPIPNARGIPIDTNGAMPAEGRRLLNVGKYQEGMPARYKGKTIGQYCVGINLETIRASCDSSGGISGSLVTVEEGFADVVAVGFVTGGVKANTSLGRKEGDPYDPNTNFANIIPIDSEIVGYIRQIVGKSGP